MNFRRLLRYFVPWIALCAVFWKPLLEGGIGFAFKSFLQMSRGWVCDYRRVEIGKRGIVFTDLVVWEKGCFQCKAEEAIVSVWDRHIVVENPRLILSEVPSWKGGNHADWTFVIRGGRVEGEGIQPFQFQGERNFPQQVGRFWLEWEEGAKLGVEVLGEGDCFKVNVAAEQFNPILLRRWFGGELEGEMGGKVYLVAKGGKIERGYFQLKGRGIRWGDRAKGIAGTIDGEGPFALNSFWEKGRLRISLDEGTFFSFGKKVEKIQGEWSFVGGMGTKWELSGEGGFPIFWRGRGFFQSLKEQWVQSELLCGTGLFSVKGKRGDEWQWEGSCNAEAEHAAWLQSFLGFVHPGFLEWELQEGQIALEGKAMGPIDALQKWELYSLTAEGLKGRGKEGNFGLGKGFYSAEKGEFSFEGGLFDLGMESVWSGAGKIVDGKVTNSKFSGKCGDFSLMVQLEGKRESFSGRVRGEGPFALEADLQGGWDGEHFFFKVDEGEMEQMSFAGSGSVDLDFNFLAEVHQFAGPLSTFGKLFREIPRFEGYIESIGNGFTVQGGREGWDWSLQAHLDEGSYPLSAVARLEKIEMEIGADPRGFACYEVKGNLIWGREFSLYCPALKSRGEFDLRLLGEKWDFLRLVGEVEEKIQIDLKKSHILGKPFQAAAIGIGQEGLEELSFAFELSWKSILAALSYPKNWDSFPIDGTVGVSVGYDCKEGSQIAIKGIDLAWGEKPFLFDLLAAEKGGFWAIDSLQLAEINLVGKVFPEKDAFRFLEVQGGCGEDFAFDLEGKIDFASHIEMKISHLSADLGRLAHFTKGFGVFSERVEGKIEGSGHFLWNEACEADFDLLASRLRTGPWVFENQGPLHVSYIADEGVSFKGLDLQIQTEKNDLSPIHCKVDLLQFDTSLWTLHGSHLHIPEPFLAQIPNLPSFFLAPFDIDLIGTISCSSDFSLLECSLSEGFLPFGGELRHVRDGYLLFDENHFRGDFSYLHQGHPLKAHFKVDLGAFLSGRLVLEEEENPLSEEEIPLTIDWSWENGSLLFRSIEGTFGGVDALFHADAEDSLIGSARIDCAALSKWVSPRIAEIFSDLKMGKGYEVKGRLRPSLKGLFFQGLLSGKQVELFGYQLRTLLGQFELTPEKVHIYDLKVSDSAGILKIDEILAEGNEMRPWTISMPHLTITELRPSLLQKVGGVPGEISPLVVRELKIHDFKGFAEDSRTYTASGELFFINSYKREYTIFDIPSDVLSRIVGLDLELLIPVRGSIKYELKDRHFHLTDLKDSYSEGARSEFFLLDEETPPTVDLDGNIQIFVKMKQFVLFKFTESFLISIDGKLDEPKFHLQKKRHFLGL